jgi:hypothetical protein
VTPRPLRRLINLLGLLLLLVGGGLLASCEGSRDEFSRLEGTPIFRPPPLAVRPSPTPGGLAGAAATVSAEAPDAAASESPAPDCVDGLSFLADLTLPDGSPTAPAAPLDKRWRVENSGTCPWTGRYRLKRTSGEDLSTPAELALYPAKPGTEAVIRVEFSAPTITGSYRASWQAVNPAGEPFGIPIYVEFVVLPPTPRP